MVEITKENEIITLRTERNKTHNLGGNKRRLVCYCGPIHYKPKGKINWEDIVLDFQDDGKGNFIADKNKVSIGFRKDKKLSKYFGVRYDYEHQFESSIKEIKLDNVEQVNGDFIDTKKTKKTEIVNEINSNVEIVNDINEVSLKNFVKVNNPIEDFKLVEELYLKGLNCSNKKTGEKYIVDKFGRFNFVDEKGELKFWINRPFFIDDKGETSQNIIHTLEEIDGKLIYTKIPNGEGQDDLILAQYPILIDTNVYYGTGIDCVCLSGPQVDWDTAHDLAVANSSDHHNASDYVYTAHSAKDGSCEIHRAFMKFDTSNLPDAATITTAILKLYGIGTHTAEVSVQEGTTSASYGTSSYNDFTGSFFAHTTLVNSQYNSLSFNVVGKANINKTGNTEYCIREYDHDYLDIDPGSGNSYMSGFYFDDEAGTTYDPKLEIDYTENGGEDYTQTCSDSVAFVTTIVKDTTKKKVLSLSAAESMSTLSAFSLSESETLEAVIATSNDINIPLDETVQMIETLVKDLDISFSDALAFTEDISKLITFNKLFSETVAIAEEIKKEPNVILQLIIEIIESASREAGSLLNISDLVAFTESLSSSLNISKQEAFTLVDTVLTVLEANRTHADTLLLTDSLQHTVGMSKQETLDFVESLAKINSKVFTETLSLTETFKHLFGLTSATAVALVDSFATQSAYSKTLSEVLELIENLQKLYRLSKVDAMSIIDAISSVSGSTQSLSDILPVDETQTSQVSILNQEILSIVESSTSLASFSRVMSDILALVETSQLHQEKPFSETLSFIESLQAVTGSEKSLSDTLSIAATYSQLTGKNMSDTIDFVETFIKQIDTLQQDSFTIVDNIIHTNSLIKTESIAIDETLIKNIDLSASSSFSIAESAAIITSFARELSELLEIVESKEFIQDKIKTIQDEIIVAEIIKKTIAVPITSTLIISEEMSTSIGEHEVDISEDIQISEDIDTQTVYSATMIETLSLVDVLIKQFGLTTEEAVSIAETHSYTKTTDVTIERLGRYTILTTDKNKTVLSTSNNKTILPMV